GHPAEYGAHRGVHVVDVRRHRPDHLLQLGSQRRVAGTAEDAVARGDAVLGGERLGALGAGLGSGTGRDDVGVRIVHGTLRVGSRTSAVGTFVPRDRDGRPARALREANHPGFARQPGKSTREAVKPGPGSVDDPNGPGLLLAWHKAPGPCRRATIPTPRLSLRARDSPC